MHSAAVLSQRRGDVVGDDNNDIDVDVDVDRRHRRRRSRSRSRVFEKERGRE